MNLYRRQALMCLEAKAYEAGTVSSVNIREQYSAFLSNLYQTPLPYVCDARDDVDRMLSIEYKSISLDGLVNASSV
jgi:DNA phosphorothioation-dependent restriction protein DptG